ncbi:formyltransferase family protein [Zavarzinia aquatilis]|uniref:Formyl transferase N-terminal domain-containing protein n=1 Tax=Zavarzinia aquatilis TaxID=2211142 RepID=A0A317EDM1_9PROT|nr:formyltransferase family protein [Zavarzinia aquatilis]PWR25128.1 hypothetical protein DKG74_05020 [Zavarzinia aquatilis]
MAKLKVVALLARRPGLLVLENALLADPEIEITALFTHGRLPRAEGGATRGDLAEFARSCTRGGVALNAVDGAEARDISPLLPAGPLDLLVALSWRYQVPASVLGRFSLGCINLHRGALPRYAGALPVQRAIEAGEDSVAITAHEMVPEIDAGAEIARVCLPIAPLPTGQTAADYAEAVKARLEPLYAPLCRLAIAARRAEREA